MDYELNLKYHGLVETKPWMRIDGQDLIWLIACAIAFYKREAKDMEEEGEDVLRDDYLQAVEALERKLKAIQIWIQEGFGEAGGAE